MVLGRPQVGATHRLSVMTRNVMTSKRKGGYIILRDSKRRYLLLRSRQEKLWQYAGGNQNPSDSTDDGYEGRLSAAKREFLELSGADVSEHQLSSRGIQCITSRKRDGSYPA